MKQRFFVDWEDQAFPQIRVIEEGSGYADPITIGEARQQIIDHFHSLIDHARNQILIAKQTTASNVIEEYEGSWRKSPNTTA